MPLITLITDFGLGDSYVAEVKAAILAAAPQARFVDVSHSVRPGDLRAAQYLLARTWQRFPPETVHLVVVDPGVGTARRALAAAKAGHRFVGPDNGVLTPVLDGAEIVSLPIDARASPTFQGRDVFAPAAGALARGDAVASLGAPVANPLRLPLPEPRRDGAEWVGEVVYVDRFGTLVTNLGAGPATAATRVLTEGVDAGPVRRTFADVASGQLVAVIGSGGTVEVAVRDGSAARVLGVGVGAVVRLS